MITCIEKNSNTTINANSIEELFEQMAYLKNYKDLKKSIGNAVFEINGLPEDEFLKKVELDKKYNSCKDYILQHYPQIKQQSDIADKMYFETALKAGGVSDLEVDIAARVGQLHSGKSLDEVTSDVSQESKVAYIQLIKVGIRVSWVQACKKALGEAIAQDTKPQFPDYPQV